MPRIIPLPERQLLKMYRAELVTFAQNPLRWEELLRGRLEDSEAVVARELFTKAPPAVLPGYPLTEGKFPSWWIALGDGAVNQQSLGSYLGTVSQNEALALRRPGLAGNPALGAHWLSSYHIMSVSDGNPDVALYLHELAKLLFYLNTPSWSQSWSQAKLSEALVMPQAVYMPAQMCIRRLTVQIQSPLVVPRETPSGETATQVATFNQDPSVSSADVGRVPRAVESITAPLFPVRTGPEPID